MALKLQGRTDGITCNHTWTIVKRETFPTAICNFGDLVEGMIPHFLIVNNPDFEYVACLHVPEYKGQEVTRFLQMVLGFQSLEQFKKNTEVYECLNNGERSYQLLIDSIYYWSGAFSVIQFTLAAKLLGKRIKIIPGTAKIKTLFGWGFDLLPII